jgi:hypothetical protein
MLQIKATLNEAREWISGNGRKRTATIQNEETRRIAVGLIVNLS